MEVHEKLQLKQLQWLTHLHTHMILCVLVIQCGHEGKFRKCLYIKLLIRIFRLLNSSNVVQLFYFFFLMKQAIAYHLTNKNSFTIHSCNINIENSITFCQFKFKHKPFNSYIIVSCFFNSRFAPAGMEPRPFGYPDVGRGDLDPLGRGGGGNLFPFPSHPNVHGGAQPRFDPFGPPGPNVRPNPNPDHFQPPNFGSPDYYM